MAVKGTQVETRSSLLTGVAEVKVLAFNPTLAEYEKIYGPREQSGESTEEPKEPEYIKTDKDGNTMLLATFIVEAVGGKYEGRKSKIVFPIIDKVDLRDSGNTLFVNDKGETSYIDMKENLKEFFLNVKKWDNSTKSMYNFRECKVREGYAGEKQFLDFLSMYLNFDFTADVETEIWIDMKKMFAGDYREMKSVVSSFTAQTVLTAWHVKTVENTETGEVKQYQNIYRNAFSNTRTRKSNLVAVFNNLNSKGVNWKDWIKANEKDYLTRNFRNFIEQITGEYRPDGFVLQPLDEYDPNSDLAASMTSKHESEEFSSNDDY